MKKFLAVVLFIVAIPLGVSAALDKFPTTPEEILEHHLENSDVGHAYVKVDGKKVSEDWDFDLGSSRSRADLEALLQNHIRDVVRAGINPEESSLEGKQLFIGYGLWKNVRKLGVIPFELVLLGYNEIVLSLAPDGKIAMPESIYAIDLLEDAMAGSGSSFFIPNILRAELTVEDEVGNVLETRTTEDSDYFSPMVFYRSDTLRIATVHLAEQRRGKLMLYYRGGTEQLFDRSSGKLLETVMPDLRPVKIESQYNGFLLIVRNMESDREVVIDISKSIPPRWEALPTSALSKVTKAANGDVSIFLDREGLGDIGFFQARVVPSAIRIR